MAFFLELIYSLIGGDVDFQISSKSYNCLFSFWEIETTADVSEIEELLRAGIINKNDVDILKLHREEILVELQTILNNAENNSKKESIRLIWELMRKYGLSDKYTKYTIVQLYHIL